MEKTSTKACELYEEARRAGVAQAACNLSVMYQHGEGVEKNITKGVSYLKRRTVPETFWRR